MTVYTSVDEIEKSAQDFALFSGGNDSIVSTHYSMSEYDIDYVVYLDTGTGIPENKEHVKDVCEQYDWPLVILTAETTLLEFALGDGDRQAIGFPAPNNHSWAYRYFKERQLGWIATHVDAKPNYYTGVRSHESTRRMKNVGGEVQEAERWTWVAPIHDWRDSAVDRYREEHDLPTNPVAEKIGRSGDCFCGAYAHRDNTLLDLEAHYPGHADWIKDLEEKVQDELGDQDEYSYWGFGGLSEKQLRSKMAKNDQSQMSLCSTCDIPEVGSTDD